MRLRWLAVGAFGVVGCQALLSQSPRGPEPVEAPAPLRVAATPEASAPTVVPVAAAQPVPPAAADSLTLAAECLERGDEPAAAAHLEAYVRAHPDQLMFRAHLAELLFRLDRLDPARAHFERFVADAQAATGPPRKHLVHCHTRLMEIGQRADDRFAEVFHRGVGLLLLVEPRDADESDEGMREEVLCKALKALDEAKELRPTDPRVRLYLADAYERSGNRRAADSARSATRGLTTPGALTPTERRRVAQLP